MRNTRAITSASNPAIKRIRRLLGSRKFRESERKFVLEGIKPARMLLDEEPVCYALEKLFVSAALSNTAEGLKLCEKAQGRMQTVADHLMERVGDTRKPQGVMAIVSVEKPSLPDARGTGRYLLLDGIADPGNMGTLIRSAAGFGYSGVFVHGQSVDVYNPKCVRATAGAILLVPVWNAGGGVLEAFVKSGYQLVSTLVDAEKSVFETAFSERSLIAIGNEAHGVSTVVRKLSTLAVGIPLTPYCESLNAAVAGSLIMALAANRRPS